MRTRRTFRRLSLPIALMAAAAAVLGASGHDTAALGVLGGLCAVLLLALVAVGESREEQHGDGELGMLHDPLTQLPNRLLFQDRVHQAILGATRTGTRAAVIVLDVDRFSDLNGALGHQMGDLLLYELGYRLTDTLRQSDSVARLSGDEFAILLPEVGSDEDALAAAAKIRGALATPVAVRDQLLEVEASAGIALYPDHGLDPETLVQHAEVAMYAAKEARSGCELYAQTREEFSPERLRLVHDLRVGVASGQLELHYQPKIRLTDNRVVGVEALARWRHPDKGLIEPNVFIPLAERTSLIRPLTLNVLEMAIEDCASWHEAGLDLAVAVNLSPPNLADHELPHRIKRMLESRGLPTSFLELELTEEAIARDPRRALDVLSRLDAMGIWLAIDDFGSGHTSAAQLKRLPVTTLKVDRPFVNALAERSDGAKVVQATLALARDLGLRVVAEGVDRPHLVDDLRALGCDLAQGFVLARPMPAADLTAWLKERERSQAAA
ncbi:MAG TPA: EAL domain-containing protein [Thermoleophilaceae bacterium]|nr:EAL domain-containing protein [Thermoleophilaceae bacterium]